MAKATGSVPPVPAEAAEVKIKGVELCVVGKTTLPFTQAVKALTAEQKTVDMWIKQTSKDTFAIRIQPTFKGWNDAKMDEVSRHRLAIHYSLGFQVDVIIREEGMGQDGKGKYVTEEVYGLKGKVADRNGLDSLKAMIPK